MQAIVRGAERRSAAGHELNRHLTTVIDSVRQWNPLADPAPVLLRKLRLSVRFFD